MIVGLSDEVYIAFALGVLVQSGVVVLACIAALASNDRGQRR